MASDDDVPRTITDIFHDIVQLGNRIRNRIASWKNTFMSVRRRRKRVFEAREYLVLLKDALDRIKEALLMKEILLTMSSTSLVSRFYREIFVKNDDLRLDSDIMVWPFYIDNWRLFITMHHPSTPISIN